MNPITKRKLRQKIQAATDQEFWEIMNWIHTQAYYKGVGHMREAMSCTPRISARMIEQVEAKATEIREQWDGLKEIQVETNLDNLVLKEA